MNPKGAFEKRWRQLGHARFTLRLKRRAMDALDALCQQHNCNRRDAIEALLLGNIEPSVHAAMRAHGFSRDEAKDWVEQGGRRA